MDMEQFDADRAEAEWGPNGKFGNDPAFVVVSKTDPKTVDRLLGLEEVTIRLPSELVNQLCVIATQNGVVCKAVIRHALQAFIDSDNHEVPK